MRRRTLLGGIVAGVMGVAAGVKAAPGQQGQALGGYQVEQMLRMNLHPMQQKLFGTGKQRRVGWNLIAGDPISAPGWTATDESFPAFEGVIGGLPTLDEADVNAPLQIASSAYGMEDSIRFEPFNDDGMTIETVSTHEFGVTDEAVTDSYERDGLPASKITAAELRGAMRDLKARNAAAML